MVVIFGLKLRRRSGLRVCVWERWKGGRRVWLPVLYGLLIPLPLFFFSFGKERTIAVLSLIMSFWTKTRAARVAPRFASSHRYDLTPGV